MSERQRNTFIDLARGLAVFLMFWGHCIQYCTAGSSVDFFENGVFKFIYSFHMPLLMLISGYLFFFSFSKWELKELLVHRTQSLLQPIVFCSILAYLATDGLLGLATGEFRVFLGGRWLSELPTLWFLWSVLVASVSVAIICKKCASLPVQLLLLMLAVFPIAFFPSWALSIYMYPYFILGFYFAKYKEHLPKWVMALRYASVPLFPVLLFFFEKKHYIYITGLVSSQYGWLDMAFIDLYRWAIGLAGALFVLTVLDLLYRLVITKIKRPLISRALTAMGRRSLQLYAFSVPFLSSYLSVLFPKALSVLGIENFLVRNMFLYNFVFTLLLAVAYGFALYGLTRLLEKWKIAPLLFGR